MFVCLHAYLTAYRTVWAGAFNRVDLLVPFVISFNEGASGADINTGPTELTAGLQQGCAVRGSYEATARTVSEGQGVIAPYFIADPYTPAANDT